MKIIPHNSSRETPTLYKDGQFNRHVVFKEYIIGIAISLIFLLYIFLVRCFDVLQLCSGYFMTILGRGKIELRFLIFIVLNRISFIYELKSEHLYVNWIKR